MAETKVPTCMTEAVLGIGGGDGWWVTCGLDDGHDGNHWDGDNTWWPRGMPYSSDFRDAAPASPVGRTESGEG